MLHVILKRRPASKQMACVGSQPEKEKKRTWAMRESNVICILISHIHLILKVQGHAFLKKQAMVYI